MAEPKGVRPQMGEAFDQWAPEGGKGSVLEWSWVQDKMYSARSYWVVTSPRSGPPHPMPVWGVFVEDVFYFSTPSTSLKAKHIARSGEASVHLESADMVVILKGEAKEVSDPELLETLARRFSTNIISRSWASFRIRSWFPSKRARPLRGRDFRSRNSCER
jgi:hypothetical protein